MSSSDLSPSAAARAQHLDPICSGRYRASRLPRPRSEPRRPPVGEPEHPERPDEEGEGKRGR